MVLTCPGEGTLLLGSKADAPSQLLRGLAGTAFESIVLTVLDKLEDERLDSEAGSAVSVTVIPELVELLGGDIEAFSEVKVEPLESLVKTGRGVIEVLEMLEVVVSTAAVTVGTPGWTGMLPTLALISVERASR